MTCVEALTIWVVQATSPGPRIPESNNILQRIRGLRARLPVWRASALRSSLCLMNSIFRRLVLLLELLVCAFAVISSVRVGGFQVSSTTHSGVQWVDLFACLLVRKSLSTALLPTTTPRCPIHLFRLLRVLGCLVEDLGTSFGMLSFLPSVLFVSQLLSIALGFA